ncbi:hypothetical protein [Kitasatospora purpeofusca]|uniref:hypothetical protein n=1 Tax=Kitasatospora purpeofusca TaxID=67352 RepID=UPI00386AA2CB|nr:hypothetical protein OIP63_26955 [Kitasatospora purpeofusca]
MLKTAITGATVPVRAVISGSPVLAARIWAPASARLDKAAGERKAIAEALAAARAAELAKLTDEKAIAKARAAHAEADKAGRAEKRERIGSTLGGAALVALVAGPVSWQLVGPWMPLATWSGIGLWCAAAMAHSPKITTGEQEVEADQDNDLDDQAADTAAEAADGQGEPQPAPPTTLPADELVAAVERMVAIRAQSDGGAGKVHLSEVLASLQRHGFYPGLEARDFGALARAAGLPFERGLRVTGRGVSVGLTAEAMRARLGHTPRLPPEEVADHSPAAAV